MGFFIRNRYYKINAILLTIIGQWPHQTSKWQLVQQIIIHLSIFSVMTVQIIRLLTTWGDIDIMIQCFTPAAVQFVAMIKSLNNMINHRKMANLLFHIEKDWSSLKSEKEINILSKYANDGRKITLAYASFLFGSLVVYLLIPMMPQILDVVLPLNDSRPLSHLYFTEYYILDQEDNFYEIVLHTYSGTIMTVSTIVAVDTMYAMSVQHVCGILAIIGYRFETITERVNMSNFDTSVSIEQDGYYWQLMDCIKKHQDAIKFAVLIESSYSNAFLFELGICVVLISVSLLQLLTKFGQYEEMFRLVQFTGSQMFHLFFNTLPGQKLMNQCADYRDSIYCAEWYGFSARCKSLIKISIMGAAIPLKITASKIYEMSMENFGKIMQTSISYFTVLASLR